MNPKAQKVIDNCKFHWPANQGDCSGFVKAVCGGLGVPVSTGQADDIVAWFRDPANGWEALTDDKDTAGNITTRKEQKAKDRADSGELVICGLTSGELVDSNGHLSIVISADLIYSASNNDYYPVGYWGKLHGVGGANKCLSFSFPSAHINQVTYAAFAF